MKWLTDGRGFVFLLILFAASPTAAVLGQEAGAAAPNAATVDTGAAGDAVFKAVLKCSGGTFHLIGTGGTVHYRIPCGHHGCCCRVAWLAKLKLVKDEDGYLYYRLIHGDPDTTFFVIKKTSSFCRHYAVWRGVKQQKPQFFGYFRLEIPN